jgi:D-alanyl-lipoteichoic acid acyltransferase DltB (MBOAT superfamily)
MVFTSLEFVAFLPVMLALYWLLPKRWQNPLLLVGSYVFYGAWDVRFLSLLWISTAVDFLVGKRVAEQSVRSRRRLLVGLSLATNLGILGFFKYFDFFAESFSALLAGIGLSVSPFLLNAVLPVGISFYTFQTLAYSIDVYRGEQQAERNFVTFALYVAFFPQLVAGPIERARRLLPQLREPRDLIGYSQFRSGMFLIVVGLFKKVAIADVLASIVESSFQEADNAGWLTLVVGVYAFALQIYGDFSGYTDMARGVARLLGIELVKNFSQPYLSRNITAFWRTWHISLSNWLRDYLYIPLGGNRRGVRRTYINLLVTMLLGGLWHGAAWTFVVWGALHGLYLAAHRRWRSRTTRAADDPLRWRDVPAAIITFQFVCVAWIFFRAESFAQAFDYLSGILTLRRGVVDKADLVLTALGFAAVVALDLVQRNSQSPETFQAWPAPARGLVYAALVIPVVVFAGAPQPFIYFQF